MNKVTRVYQASKLCRSKLAFLRAKLSKNRNALFTVILSDGTPITLHGGNSSINSIPEIFGTRAYHEFLSLVKPGDLFIDIGANIGIVSLAAAKRGAIVEAYEPDIRLHKLFHMNTDQYGTVHLRAEGVAGISGTRKLMGTETGFGGSSLVLGDGHFSQSIQCLGINDILNPLQSLDFMKMDIEGAEAEVLDAIFVENLKKISNILIEYHEPVATESYVVDKLLEAGFMVTKSSEFCAVIGTRPDLG